MKHVAAALTGLFLLLACTAAPPAAPSLTPAPTIPSVEVPDLEARLARLTERLERERETGHIAGMALAIVKDDEIVYAKGFGLADLERKLPVTPETLFAIGSSSKAFTVNAIGMLIDEGKMSWDDPITRHLPYFKLPIDAEEFEEAPEVTVRDLLCHRTGFTRMGVLWAAGRTDRRTILETATHAEPWSPFRKAFFYNNVMYLAAGEAAGAAADSDWDSLVEERFFTPLGMDDSNTSVVLSQRDPRLSLGYFWNEEQEEFEHLPMRVLDVIAPAGAINSNVLDMAQWLRLQLGRGSFAGRQLIGADRIEETWTPQIEIGGGTKYGLGWMLSEWQGRRVVEHGGNIDGFAAQVAMLPDAGIGFVLLTNVGSTPLQQSARGIVWDALLGEAKTPSAEGVAETPEAPADSLDDYLGTYIANYAQFDGERFEVSIQNGRLALDIPSQMVFELLEPNEEGRRPFVFAPDTIQASFERDETGEVVILKLYQSGMTFEVPREGYPLPPDGTEEEFAAYYGTYSHPLLPAPFTVLYKNGRVVCDIPEQMQYELRLPDDEGIWSFRTTDLIGLEFHPDDTGQVVSLTFHERGTETICRRLEEGLVELPTIDEVLALRDGAAISEKIEALDSLRFSGTVRLVHSGIEGTQVVTFAGHDRFLTESSFEPFGSAKSGYDGKVGWSESTFQEFDEVEGKFLDQLRLSHPAVFFGDWNRYFDSMQVVSTSTDENRRRWVVRLTKGELPPWSAHVDAETGDIVRVDAKTVLPTFGTVPQTTFLEDYREVHGIRLPHRIITETVVNGRVVVRFETIEAGLALPTGIFSPPAK